MSKFPLFSKTGYRYPILVEKLIKRSLMKSFKQWRLKIQVAVRV
ncbi:hypothetical protein [Nitrosomonas eutropha]|nr:hypothetical protein [Nitrosomonas eutropha]